MLFIFAYIIISQLSELYGLMASYIRIGADILPIMWHISRDSSLVSSMKEQPNLS